LPQLDLLRHVIRDAVAVGEFRHIPLVEDEDGLLLLNPGSPTDRRRQPEHTFALLRVEEREARAEIKVLP